MQTTERRVTMQHTMQTGLVPHKWNLDATNYYTGTTIQEWMQGTRKAAMTTVPERGD